MLEGYRLQVIDDLLRLNDPIPVVPEPIIILRPIAFPIACDSANEAGSHYT